jgi:signal transduction histidine kinase
MFVDSGIGIPEHIQSQLFKTIGTTTPGTHMEKGSGFGLAICHEYAKKNAAKLSVKSEVGTGSIFSLEIPITASIETDLNSKTPDTVETEGSLL